MTEAVNISKARKRLSHLIDRAIAGEDVVIARLGKPMVWLVPIESTDARGLGLLKGIVGPEPEGFFDPLAGNELVGWR